MVELHHVLVNMLPIFEGQMVELMLSITDWIMRAKICLEFQDEFLIILHPQGTEFGRVRGGVEGEVRVVCQEEVGFEPS